MITGDIFVDAGDFAINELTQLKGNKENAIKFIIDLYLTKWNKAIYSFFPNSFFIQPGDIEYKRSKLYDIYLNGNYDSSFRDKIILSGSGSFVNFYPNMQSKKEDLDIIIKHLACPLVSFRFPGQKLFTLITGNQIKIIQEFWKETLETNIYKDYPVTLEFNKYNLVHALINRAKTENISFDIYDFTNYAQSPEVKVSNWTYERFKRSYLEYLYRDKKLWEINPFESPVK